MLKTYDLIGYEEDRLSCWNILWNSCEHDTHKKIEESFSDGLRRVCSCGLKQTLDYVNMVVGVYSPENDVTLLNPETAEIHGLSGGGAGFAGTGGLGAPRYDGPQWEYKTAYLTIATDQRLLEWGLLGWELVAILSVPDEGLLFFKRPKQ